jgi:hypothetical protein
MQTKGIFRICLISIFILTALAGCAQATPTEAVPAATAEPIATEAPQPVETESPAESVMTWQVTDAGPLIFSPGSTSMQMPGDLQPGTGIRFSVTAMRGQQMTFRLTTEPASTETLLATLYIKGQSGNELTPNPVDYWSQVLPEDQTYTVEIRSLADTEILYSLITEIPAEKVDPALGDMYDLIDAAYCQDFTQIASDALGVQFFLEERAPFMDVIGGEAGQGCRISTGGNGAQFTNPQDVVTTLVNSVGLGWTEAINYQAGGPTGAATGLYRDMGLMLIEANWQPAMGVVCPTDQPIEACSLTDDQKTYSVEINVAQYKADFSMDGHWVDDSTGFTLDLYQDWKQIYGEHTVVAQNGNKIDSLEASINGMLKDKVASVTFQSSFTDQPGTAEITYVDVNTIQWKIISAPQGEYYLPAEATLTRTAQ